MFGEEVADPVGAQVSNAEAFTSRQNHRVRQNNPVAVDSALQIAENELSTGSVVGEMREGLHHARPRRAVVRPSGIRVEFLPLLDERLLQALLATINEFPDFRHIHSNDFVGESCSVPLLYEVTGFLGRFDIEGEI